MREVNPWRTALVIFLACGALYGVCMSLLLGPQHGSRFTTGLTMGIPFGLFMAATLGGLHVVVGRRSGGGKTPHVAQSAEVVIGLEPRAAVAVTESALRTLNVRQLETTTDEPVRIVARTRMTWKSWGELVEATITAAADGGSLIRIASRPLLGPTLVDYGKGLDNVNRCVAAIRALEGPQGPQLGPTG